MPKPIKPITYTLNGTQGNDLIELETGQLLLNGASRTVTTGATQVTVNGGSGNDIIRTDSPHTYVAGVPVIYDGGAGSDTMDFSSMTSGVAVQPTYVTRTSVQYSISTGFGWYAVADQPGGYYDPNDPQRFPDYSVGTRTSNLYNVENLVGTSYDDYLAIYGTSGGRVEGGDGNDVVRGSAGADVLFGGTGNDQLAGLGGNDMLTGGSGADQFLVLANNGVEVITDFNWAEGDRLYIGYQNSPSEVATAQDWYATTWTDSAGVVHNAIRADFQGGATILVDVNLTPENVAAVNASTSTYDWFA